MPQFSTALRHARQCAGLTQQQLASRVGLAKSTVCMYERGDRCPNFATLQKLAEALGTDAGSLLAADTASPTALSRELDTAFFSLAGGVTALHPGDVALLCWGHCAPPQGPPAPKSLHPHSTKVP